MITKDFLETLNPEQLKAVNTIEGPVMVAAGPGTGKTQILACRIANILTQTDVPPDAVLALTFTESGVRAMRERLIGLIGPTAYYVNIATFHSFCSDIIKAYPDQFALTVDLEPLSDLQRLQIFREIIDSGEFSVLKPFTNHYYYVPAIIKSIQDLKREGVLPCDLSNLIGGDVENNKDDRDVNKQLELLTIYKNYEKVLKEKGLFDFEDMINYVIQKFKDDENFLRIFQERYQYILVDEFQDTNSAQNEVVNLLCSYWDEPNIFVVGDANQSIYRFQGASTENMVGFAKRYPTCKKITLTKNYRSTQIILDAATELISKNELRLSKIFPEIPETLESQNPKSQIPNPKIFVGEFSSATTENLFVVKTIQELIKSGVNPAQIAVIYRNNRDSAGIADLLARFNISYNLEGGQNILDDYDLRKFLLLLKAIKLSQEKNDDLAWFTLFNYEFLKFEPLDVLKLSRFASVYKINFIEAINHPDFETVSAVRTPDQFKKFLLQLLKWQQLDAEKSFVEFFELVLNESGFLNWLLNLPDAYDKLNKLNTLFSEVKKLNFSNRTLGLTDFLKSLELMQENHLGIQEEDLNIDTGAVRLTTAHRAKGLEFEYVFITCCVDKHWGNNVSRELLKLPAGIIKNIDLDKKEKNEDERRLFYVAVTRAKKQLFITSAKTYSDDTSRQTVPSMFLVEVSSKYQTLIDVTKHEENVKLAIKEVLSPVASAIDPKEDEQAFLSEVLRDFKLSVTALDTYLQCHYKFKLNNILRTPRAKSKSLSLGTAVHVALEKLFREFKGTGELPSFEFLLAAFKEAAEKELLSKKDLHSVLSQGEKILTGYYKESKARFQKPLYTEKLFGYGFGKIFLGDIPLVGKVDRVDLIDPTSRLVRVVDYKTGKPKTRGEIEGTTKYSDGSYKRQLVFYRLLIDLDKTFNYEFAEAELDFIGDKGGDGRREVFAISKAETEELKKTIKEAIAGIRGHEFSRTKDFKACTFCDFKQHCWPEGIPAGINEQQELGL